MESAANIDLREPVRRLERSDEFGWDGRVTKAIIIAILGLATLTSCRSSPDGDIRAIHTVRLHNLEKTKLSGNALLLSGWTLDDELNVVMLYSETDKPCNVDTSKEVVAAQYEVVRDNGKHVFAWQLQPNDREAGCVLEFARIGPGDDQSNPQQK